MSSTSTLEPQLALQAKPQLALQAKPQLALQATLEPHGPGIGQE